MEKDVKRILIKTNYHIIYETFKNNLIHYFGDHIEVDMYEKPEDVNGADLFLVSVRSLLLSVPEIPEGLPVLVAKRTIDLANIEKLLDVGPKTQCLLVSNDQSFAEENVEILNNMGFEHLNLIPYSPKVSSTVDVSNIEIAITNGMTGYVPASIKNTIDVGARPIDLSTILDIARILGLSAKKANLYTAQFFQDFIRLGRKLSSMNISEKQVNRKLESVLNAVHEGVISIDKEKRINVFNQEASKILEIQADDCIGRHYEEILPAFNIDEVYVEKNEIVDQLLNLKTKLLLVTKLPLMMGNHFLGIVVTFQDVTKVQQVEKEIRKRTTKFNLETKYEFDHIISVSPLINRLKKQAMKMAKSNHTVMIIGESGTGKEMFAQAIHNHSDRSEGPFVPVNFAGLSDSLVESELFGYEEGAFTGARRGGKMGLFELAHNGTIFLDEIGDAPLHIQTRLLRVLQEREVMRVGGSEIIPVDVRVIVATNKKLEEMIENSEFRQDLYYRLNVLPLHLPSLRKRSEDVLELITYFVKQLNSNLTFSDDVKEILSSYSWPGNIRELENVVNYLNVTVDDNHVLLQHLPDHLTDHKHVEQHHGRIDETIQFLKRHGNLENYKEILTALVKCEARNERVGRGTLTEILAYTLSDAQLRRKLEILNIADCVNVGMKRQGTRISDFGKEVYKSLLKTQA